MEDKKTEMELARLQLEIRDLKRTAYIPWLTSVLTILSMIIGFMQAHKSTDSQLWQFNRTIITEFDRDRTSRDHDYRKFFLDKRTDDYMKAVGKAAEIAAWPADPVLRAKDIAEFIRMHDGTMQLYEDEKVLDGMIDILDAVRKAEVDTSYRYQLPNYVHALARYCRASLVKSMNAPYKPLEASATEAMMRSQPQEKVP